MPGCYITGQAAGVAAAMAVQNATDVHRVRILTLQAKLKEMGAYLPNFKGSEDTEPRVPSDA